MRSAINLIAIMCIGLGSILTAEVKGKVTYVG